MPSMKMSMSMTPRMNMRIETRFAERCAVPRTIRLALSFRSLLEPIVNYLPHEWSFDDRVVGILVPWLTPRIDDFYDGDGPSMFELLDAAHLRELDEDMYTRLSLFLQIVGAKYQRSLPRLGLR